MIAACNGHEACVRVLIAANADVLYANSGNNFFWGMKVLNTSGWTALHGAARFGHASICRVLVDEGASLTAVNNDGKTPFEFAIERGYYKCMAILDSSTAATGSIAFVEKHIAAATRGFRFAVTKAADEQAPLGVDEQIFNASRYGKLDELLGLGQEWAGHGVIDVATDKVSQVTSVVANFNVFN